MSEMAGSYRKIDYSVRPCKAVERKMLCEAFQRLYPFARVDTYRYVGFGSVYFSDFQLFHRTLGMRDMLSIEKDAHAKECFEFNRPYRCVKLDFRPASDVLPELDWSKQTIAWLDYDCKLTEEVLSDVGTVCARATSGSMLVLSVNAQVEPEADELTRKTYETETGSEYNLDTYRLRSLKQRVGSKVPPETTGADLRGKGLGAVSRRAINSVIEAALSARNGTLPMDKRIVYEQTFNFLYKDDALMLSVGGVFYERAQRDRVAACAFSELNFVRDGDAPYVIDVPCLTLKEMRHLSAHLPEASTGEALALPGLPPSQARRFAEVYRYFPTFAEAIFT